MSQLLFIYLIVVDILCVMYATSIIGNKTT